MDSIKIAVFTYYHNLGFAIHPKLKTPSFAIPKFFGKKANQVMTCFVLPDTTAMVLLRGVPVLAPTSL